MTEGQGSVRSKIGTHLLKLFVGVAIVVLVATQLTLVDVVGQKGKSPKEGRHVAINGAVVLTDKYGAIHTFPLESGPIVESNGGHHFRVRDLTRTVEGAHLVYEGVVSLTLKDGTKEELPLESVALKDGATDGPWTERLLAVDEGLYTIFGRLSLGPYALAMLLMAGMYVCGVLRWRVLLRAQDLDVSLFEATRLTFIGFFFNNVVPGLTGGDVVKAVMIARRNKGRGPAAVSTVIVDRALGLLVLAAMSGVVLLATLPRYAAAATAIFGFLGVAGAGIVLFFSRRVRRFLRLDALVERLPAAQTLKTLDQAFLRYRSHKGAVVWALLLSVGSHVCNILSIYLMGSDLGVDRSAGLIGQPVVTYFATIPIILIGSSVPLLPGGWGLGELMYAYFFRAVGVRNVSLSVGLSVLSRASMLAWSLIGGLFLLFDRQSTKSALKAAEQPDAVLLP